MAASMRRRTCKGRLKMVTHRRRLRLNHIPISNRNTRLNTPRPNTLRNSLMQIRRQTVRRSLSTYSQTRASRQLPFRQ